MADAKPETAGATEDAVDTKPGAESGAEAGADQAETKTFTQADLDRMVSKAHERWKTEMETALQAERKRTEEARLSEEGKFRELFESRDLELNSLRSELKARQFREESMTLLAKEGLSEFAEVLLSPRETVEDLEAATKTLKDILSDKVQAEVVQRLDTGKRPSSSGLQRAASLKDFRTDDEKSAFIKEHGPEAFARLVLAEGA